MNSNDMTITQGRLEESIKNAVNHVMGPNITQQISKTVEEERIQTGRVIRFYPYIDKALVRLDASKKKVMCKILHRCGGDMIDFYTPLESEKKYDDKLNEPYILPRANQDVCVLKINNGNSNVEHIILGYYNKSEIVGFSPASPGNVKFVAVTETNPYWLSFGRDGLDVRLSNKPTAEVGVLGTEMTPLEYTEQKTFNSTVNELNTKIEDIGSTGAGGLASFRINEDGHLIASLPSGNVNPYRLGDDGHLYYNTEV